MKFLIVSKIPTHPTHAGNSQFILGQAEKLRALGCDLSFLYIEESPLSRKRKKVGVDDLRCYWKEELFIYKVSVFQKLWMSFLRRMVRPVFSCGYTHVDDEYPWGVSRYVNKLHDKYGFDGIIVNYFYLSRILSNVSIPIKGLTTHDYFSYKNLLIDPKTCGTYTNMHEEAKAMQRSPNIFALNTEEAILFRKMSPKSHVFNVFGSFTYIPTPKVGNKVILFLSGSNPFNISGLNKFIEEAFPLIVEKYPDCILKIGGSICSKIQSYNTNPNIQLVGMVDDLKEFYESADICINPTYQGTGLKIKTFESVSFDKVTLVDPHSVIGVYDSESAPIYVCERPYDWIKTLTRIWEEDLIDEIKESNRAYMNKMNRYIESQYLDFLKQK